MSDRGARGVKSVTGHKSDDMAKYDVRHADQIEINQKVAAAWDDALVGKQRSKKVRRVI